MSKTLSLRNSGAIDFWQLDSYQAPMPGFNNPNLKITNLDILLNKYEIDLDHHHSQKTLHVKASYNDSKHSQNHPEELKVLIKLFC